QCPYDQSVHRHPYRSSPVRIATKHACVRFSRKVLDFVLLSSQVGYKRMIQVIFRQRTYAVGTEELVLIEHVLQNAHEFWPVASRKEPAPHVPAFLEILG